MVYAGKVNDQVLTLQVSGMLWNRSLVMRDIETGSLWSQLLGRCMRGKLKDKTLKLLPSVMTSWADWKKQYPDTTAINLSRTATAFKSSFYKNRELFVLGIVYEGKVRAYRFKTLFDEKIIQDEIGGAPVLVSFDPDSTRTAIFLRTVNSKALSFTKKMVKVKEQLFITDRETESLWNPQTGKAVSGPLKGSQLFILPSIVSFSKAWKTFHPDSNYR